MIQKLLLILCIVVRDLSAQPSERHCVSKEECLDKNGKCRCYSAEQCGWREKREGEEPVFVPQDPRGKYCYCSQKDLDHYYIKQCSKPHVQ